MNTVSIKPEILVWARRRAGFDVAELEKPFPKLAEWEKGISSPPLNQLEKLAKRLWAPLGYFFLPSPPEERLPIPDYRSIDDTPVQHPSPDLLETIFSMQRRQQWYKDFIFQEGASPLPLSGRLPFMTNQSRWQIACGLCLESRLIGGRRFPNGKWDDAFGALWINAEQAGVIIVCNGGVGNNTSRVLDVEEFRGFVLPDSYAPLIFINNVDAKAGQMFTLAHELAHIWIGSAGVLNFRDMKPANNPTELFCNAVAAEFLVPADKLASAWLKQKSFSNLANLFKVSPLVIARRALDAGDIGKAAFFQFYNSFRANVKAKRDARDPGGNFYSTCEYRIGRPFADAVARAAKGGKWLSNEAYRLTGLKGETFDKYILKMGMDG